MQLTRFSDYALRVLLFVHAAGDRLVTIEEMADVYGISRSHLMKVVNVLSRAGYITAIRGRHGGLRLAKRASDINIGKVLRLTEPDFTLVECFATGNQCLITQRCKLRGILRTALGAFLVELDQHTLESIAIGPRAFPGMPKSA